MNDKSIISNKKARESKRKGVKSVPHDLFTTLCHTDLGEDCVKEFKFHPKRKWRFDYAIVSHKIALEVEGGVWTHGRHTSSKGFLGDMEKYNCATLMGWRVFRTTPDSLLCGATLELLKNAIKNDFNPQNSQLFALK